MPSVLFVCHGFPLNTMGGVGKIVETLIQHMASIGWDVHLLTPQQHRITRTKITNTKYSWGTHHTLHTSTLLWHHSWSSSSAIGTLQTLCQEWNFDICHIHHLSGLPLDWKHILPTHCKLVLTLHDYALPCARGQLYHRDHYVCSGPTMEKCTLCLEPFLQWYAAKQKYVEQRLDLVQQLLSRADIIQSPSVDLQKRCGQLYPSVSIELVHLPVDTIYSTHFLSSVLSSVPKTRDCIFVGSIIPTKGLHLVLKAMHHIHRLYPKEHYSLGIIGSGFPTAHFPTYEQHCHQLAMGLDIVWYGTLSAHEIKNILPQYKTLVVPSLWPENSPISIREAKQFRLDIVCPRYGGSAELSTDAWLVGDPLHHVIGVSALAETIRASILYPKNIRQEFPTPMEFGTTMQHIYQKLCTPHTT